ncbi:ribonuclease BN (tRNA processing enzyme) [Scopulibacillus darangshiensis]|uniref:Ribonuclease BN (tRNA processing enzyme) n=1 Tax=Scopulibacillus darangshiensis TaxID=442528 RepID=A0A4R2P1Y0_9BACL|nr:MBL fold metallo-hydrolase [Scopulibacillus darangshiensis]TCP28713.1 ribonuclease BN (tRNA processing enzyme) [Scopulibacillus darangshiensis]
MPYLNFIGTGSAFNTNLGNNSAYLFDQDALFLIDCGSSVFGQLKCRNNFQTLKAFTVLLTHLHPDHAGSLGDLIFYSYYIVKNKVQIFFPKPQQVRTHLRSMGVSDDFYDLQEIKQDTVIHSGGFQLTVTPQVTNHVPELDCFGYFIGYDGNSLYYSGDSNMINPIAKERLEKGSLHAFYQDTCQLDYEGNVHLSITKLQQEIGQPYRSKVYCMHIDETFDIEQAKALGFHVVEGSQHDIRC